MQTPAVQHMAFDQRMDRGKRHTGMTNQIGKRRQAEVNAFSCNALGLAVQWLVLAIFVKGDHGDQAGPGPSTWDRMEGCWWLADLLAGSAGELLADRLDHLPLARDHFKRLSDVLTHLHDPVGTSTGTVGRRLNHDTFARQVVGKGFAPWLARRKGAHGAGFVLCCNLFSRQRIFGGGGFQFLKLQFQLIDQSRTAFGRDAVFVAAQWSAPTEWSKLIVSAWLASGLLA
jgi:hypothetical protein